ncbi:H repeat-associated protein YhhI (fragment) [Xenorhabdus bovienii str. puntauvense]|uniref:H repeat-associated protein YhhI n=1 Tax=Xenorhabdus bovienii str. puntauvense TaxID=1398201 RepID=A0A077NET1_XENBV
MKSLRSPSCWRYWILAVRPSRLTRWAASTKSLTRLSRTKPSYFITSHRDKSADFIACAIRSHWHIETKLHWQLDVSFGEDGQRLRSGHAAENMALMNKIALNLLKNEKTVKVGVKTKRQKAGWDNVIC